MTRADDPAMATRRAALAAGMATLFVAPASWAQPRRTGAQQLADRAKAMVDADNTLPVLLRARPIAREGVDVATRARDISGLLDAGFVLGRITILLLVSDEFTGAEDTLGILTRTVAAVRDPRAAAFTEQMAFMASVISFHLGQREGNAPARMRETLRLQSLCVARYQRVAEYHNIAASASMALGDWARARASAQTAATVELATLRPGAMYFRTLSALETAAMAAARQGDWPAAWGFFERARARDHAAVAAPAPALATLERVFDSADAVVALACSESAAQLWVATKQGGLRATRCIDIPGANRLRRETLLFGDYWYAAIRANRYRGYWGGYMAMEQPGQPTGSSTIFNGMMGELGTHLRTFFGGALDAAFAAARAQGAQRVIWAPHADFTVVPVAGVAGADGRYLCEGAALKQVSGLGDVLPAPRRGRCAVDVIAPPDNVDIPLAQVEAKLAARALPSAPGANVIVHAATHAGFTTEGMRIAVGDGRTMDSRQFATRYFRGRAVRLLVLSACESGFDVPRGHDSILAFPPRAFLGMGAAGVIASLWSVDDAATFFLMARMYQAIAGGAEPDVAFGQARSWIIRARRADLSGLIASLQQTGAVTAPEASAATRALGAAQGETPFSAPRFWAAWIYFGA